MNLAIAIQHQTFGDSLQPVAQGPPTSGVRALRLFSENG
jgi:hypothetical protein